MKLPVTLFPIALLLCMLLGCAPASTPTPVATFPPSPEPNFTATVAAASKPEITLVAGQWNSLFYHPQLQKVVLVNGGPDRGKAATDPLELWTWDGEAWTLLSADPDGPVWRNFAGVAFDSKRDRLVIYGGVQDQGSRLEDTWEWDGSTWARFEAAGPGFREGAMMAYDDGRAQVILYGGANESFEILGDTWAWDGVSWTQVSTTGPEPRFPSAIVYDPLRETVLLYSGHYVGESTYVEFDDQWEWDGTAWHEIPLTGVTPGARNIAQMVFHRPGEQILLFGGGQEKFLGDMWSWDGAQWAQLMPHGAPARSGLGGAYDPVRKRLVAFGGVEEPGGTAITDTWEWDGQSWTCVHGCP